MSQAEKIGPPAEPYACPVQHCYEVGRALDDPFAAMVYGKGDPLERLRAENRALAKLLPPSKPSAR